MANLKLKINSKNCPLGVFTFAAITGKGILNDQGKEDKLEYKVTLQLPLDIAQDLLDTIDDFIEDNAPTRCELTKVPYQTHEDYEGVPEGMVWLYAKTNTTYFDKKDVLQEQEISIYDTSGNKSKLPEGMGVGNGSTGKVFGNMDVWERKKEYGATIYLTGIQIANFIPYEFEEAVEDLDGDFNGFDTPALEKAEQEDEATSTEPAPRRKRKPRR